MSGGGKSFGGSGSPGFLSGFDKQAAQQALQGGTAAITNRYSQLGLGQVQATPSGPTTGATPGIPGSGTTPTSLYAGSGPNVPGNIGAGPTAMQMDLGQAPSLTGGLPEEVQAMLGQVQTQDLQESGAQQSGKTGSTGQAIGSLGKLAGGGK